MLITSKNFKWHDDQILTWTIKDIEIIHGQELSNNLHNHNFMKRRHYANLSFKRVSTPKGSIHTLPQKSKCYLSVSEYSMLN